MEDELDFIYNGAMDVANNGNLPDRYDWDVFDCIYNAESEGG